jgi:hypothetical protein
MLGETNSADTSPALPNLQDSSLLSTKPDPTTVTAACCASITDMGYILAVDTGGTAKNGILLLALSRHNEVPTWTG